MISQAYFLVFICLKLSQNRGKPATNCILHLCMHVCEYTLDFIIGEGGAQPEGASMNHRIWGGGGGCLQRNMEEGSCLCEPINKYI